MKRIEDVAARAAKTAVQAFCAFVVANMAAYAGGVTDVETAKAAGMAMLVAALGAAFSAGWNVIQNAVAPDGIDDIDDDVEE